MAKLEDMQKILEKEQNIYMVAVELVALILQVKKFVLYAFVYLDLVITILGVDLLILTLKENHISIMYIKTTMAMLINFTMATDYY